MKWFHVILIFAGLIILFLSIFFILKSNNFSIVSPISQQITPTPTPKPLLVYTFENLAKREYKPSKIILDKELEEYSNEKHISKLFFFESDSKKISGQINIPMTPKSNRMPVIIMLRGYVDQEIYKTGIGTNKAAGVLADNGYVTLAPDFLGYGSSDMPQNDVWWERLNNPVQVLNLIASLDSLGFVDTNKIGIWAHSNGGQIAISVLEISGQEYPTVLWAPVTKPFPYSILYYTDEFDDKGKALRKELARFEQDYNVDDFSITQFLDKIQAPIQLSQGTADEAVPQKWSDDFVDKLKDLDKDITYNVYSGADHNMLGSWNNVVTKDLEFFKEKLK